ncbi:MAG: aminoglycoside phosphotransferase family protein [Candidatus Solibacter sp.]
MISEWKTYLTSHAAQWGLPASGDWRFLLYNNYQPQCSDLNLFWFHEGGAYPRAVTKVLRESARGEREFANLLQAHASAPRWVPRPLHFGALGKFWTLWMEGVPGVPFQGSVTPAVLESMVGAVSGIHQAFSKAGSPVRGDRWQQTVAEPLQSLSSFGASKAVRDGASRLTAKASAEWLRQIPQIPQHGDLYAGNLLVQDDRWHVVDWEVFGLIDLAGYDLYTLLLSLLRSGGDELAHWDPELVRQIPALVKKYANSVGLDGKDMPALLPLTLANWFHLQWRDGRLPFCDRLYRTINSYFEQEASWERVFFAV